MTVLYQTYFGLAEAPFSIAPTPRFLYLSQRHQEALAHLLYGIEGDGGFVLLTGEVGAGKTTVCRHLLDRIPETCEVAYIFNPRLTVTELLATLCDEFGIASPPGDASIKDYFDRLYRHLLDSHAQGRHAVLIIDEAQNLAPDVLEQMRLLTNLETSERKLLQIVLLGQPELGVMLARPELRQLAQRIVARYHLGALTRHEVGAYIRHRLAVAGSQAELFPPALVARIHSLTGGIPRLINLLCDRALLGAYVQGRPQVDRRILAGAAGEIFGHAEGRRTWAWRAVFGAAILIAGLGSAVAVYWRSLPDGRAVSAPSAVPVAAPRPERLEWPPDVHPSDGSEEANTALFRAWGLEYSGGDGCAQAGRYGLSCLAARGGLDDLKHWNRPAVLQMRDGQGKDFLATLVALDSEGARFVVAGHERAVGATALAEQWTGRYSLLWRQPAQVSGAIRPGSRGPQVIWLRQHLDLLDGHTEAGGPAADFDADLERRLKRFQLEQGLMPDGSVGPKTLVRLVGLADPDAPRLVRAKEVR
ncbi:MAG: AAA family ATPase [Thiobacillus sp.]|nr:AAA family ATPase [Thiobacillus sp.]